MVSAGRSSFVAPEFLTWFPYYIDPKHFQISDHVAVIRHQTFSSAPIVSNIFPYFIFCSHIPNFLISFPRPPFFIGRQVIHYERAERQWILGENKNAVIF